MRLPKQHHGQPLAARDRANADSVHASFIPPGGICRLVCRARFIGCRSRCIRLPWPLRNRCTLRCSLQHQACLKSCN